MFGLLVVDTVSGRATWGALIAGIASLTMGVLFRIGRLRGMGRYYDDPLFPTWVRNCGLGFIPIGMVFLCWFVSGLLTTSAERVSLWAALLSLVLIAAAMWVTYAPPGWIKPRWMRNGERWDAAQRS